MMSKSEFRSKIKSLQSAITSSELKKQSTSICSFLMSWFQARNIQHVGIYMAMSDEINLAPFICSALDQERTIYAPKYVVSHTGYCFSEIKSISDVKMGKFNIPEPLGNPVDINQIQAILSPGLAFDPTGVRLGRGGGFYDRIFSKYLGIRIGICAHSQIIPNLPVESWDQRVHWICNEKDGMKECREN
jgi:5-formyltetrahydrofolate cyclo-ligase